MVSFAAKEKMYCFANKITATRAS